MPTFIVVTVFAVPGLLMLGFYWYTRRKAQATQHWPQTSGQVTAADIKVWHDSDSGDMYKPQVAYTYEVNGRPYSGKKIQFGSGYVRSQKQAQAVVDKYQAGSAVVVSYNPDKPETAVLEPGASAGNRVWLFVGLAFLVAGTLTPALF